MRVGYEVTIKTRLEYDTDDQPHMTPDTVKAMRFAEVLEVIENTYEHAYDLLDTATVSIEYYEKCDTYVSPVSPARRSGESKARQIDFLRDKKGK